MPSKVLLRPAEALAEARRVPGAAQAVTGELDVNVVLARRDQIIGGLDDAGQVPWLEDRGVTLIRGHGRPLGVGVEVALDYHIEPGAELLVAVPPDLDRGWCYPLGHAGGGLTPSDKQMNEHRSGTPGKAHGA